MAYEVNITDVGDELIKNGIKAIDNRIDAFFVAKGKITSEEKAAIMGRIRGCSTVEEAVKGVDFVIEAIPEVMGLKKAVFKKLDELLPDALLASNTSSLNITEMVVGAKRPDRMVGMHFFNPVAMMKLVEVVRGAPLLMKQLGLQQRWPASWARSRSSVAIQATAFSQTVRMMLSGQKLFRSSGRRLLPPRTWIRP